MQMKRWGIVLVALASSTLALVACDGEGDVAAPTAEGASVGAPGTDADELSGRIAFMRGDEAEEASVVYTVDPDGSDERRLIPEGNSARPTWSPDGTEIHVFCCNDGMVAHFIDPETGEVLRALPPPEPSLETYCGGSWSPDGKRISCEGFGVEDRSLNGVYTIRTSDGGGLRRVTSPPNGGFDIPGEFSPDGQRLVFARWIDDEPVGVFVTELDGSGVVRISPQRLLVDDAGFSGSWAPDGSKILFVARRSAEHHKEIWVVDADGSSARRFTISPPCGGRFTDTSSAGCYSPDWSPDGSMIVFTRSSPDGGTENIYIVKADGTGLVQVTDGGADDNADWGTPPDAP
jgi:dipeptidyl aminopeptidase/acylaminoacyl peptidase